MFDQYGQLSPYNKKGHYGQRWDAPPIPFYGDVRLGNMTKLRCYLGWIEYHDDYTLSSVRKKLAVGIEYHGFFTFEPGFTYWRYIAEKLRLLPGDAKNFADLLNTIFSDTIDNPNLAEQGTYDYFPIKEDDND